MVHRKKVMVHRKKVILTKISPWESKAQALLNHRNQEIIKTRNHEIAIQI